MYDQTESGGEQYQPFLEALERNWPPEAALARREVHGYDRETCLLFGQWMLAAVTEVYGEHQSISREMIEQASKHGFGPSERPIKDNFGGALWRFNETLGSMYGRAVRRFEDWTLEDFAAYGQRVILQHGLDKPDKAAFDSEFQEGRGPSLALIASRFETRGAFFELLGYVDTKSWSRDDYIAWAADVIAAGIGLDFNAVTIKHIAKFRMGPSDKAIYKKIGSLPELERAAQTRLENYTDEDVEAASQRFGIYTFVTAEDATEVSTRHVLSTRLRTVATDGQVSAHLSAPAVIMLNQLLNHVDAPVYREDFYEHYFGNGRSRADSVAFEELQQLPFLANHLVSLQIGSERIYGLSTQSNDISLLIDRSEAAARYMSHNKLGFKPEEDTDEAQSHHLRTVTLSALGLAAAGATILAVRRSRMRK